MGTLTPREIRALRERLGLTQAAFCERYAIGNQASLSDWESGRREPGIAAQTLLRMIARDPETVAALAKTGVYIDDSLGPHQS